MSRPKSRWKRILVCVLNASVSCLRKRKAVTFFWLFLVAMYLMFSLLTAQSSNFQQETFSVADSFIGLPSQCMKVASRLNACQQSSASSSSRTNTASLVFACHQTWCNQWGHCGLCSGIGDRFRNLMSLVQDAFDRCVSFQIDAPQTGLAMREDIVYHDPWGLLAEWFHLRSYDVTSHRVNVNEWSPHHQSRNRRRRAPIFVHMTPEDNPPKRYDPCLFHILFRPSRMVQQQLDTYMTTITRTSKNVIGMHLRAGDLPAFGLTDYKDSRVSNLKAAMDKMIECGQALAGRLALSHTNQTAAFFLATDHRHAKELAKQHKYSHNIFTTDIVPLNYQRHEGDAHAWLEIWILSKMKGLVTNVVPKGYAGTAGSFSYFALLAANMGFMNSTQLYQCQL